VNTPDLDENSGDLNTANSGDGSNPDYADNIGPQGLEQAHDALLVNPSCAFYRCI
jgi:hypothetical protein